jgi:hypothetical protein
VLQGLSKEEFLKLATEWYEEEYAQAYEHYHRKGKAKGLYLPARCSILDGFFTSNSQAWKAYVRFAEKVRPLSKQDRSQRGTWQCSH